MTNGPNPYSGYLGGGGTPSPAYRSLPGYFSMGMNFNPNQSMMDVVTNALKGVFFPTAKGPQAPSFLSAYDFQLLQRMQRQRGLTQQQYKFNPVSLSVTSRMLSGLGFDDPTSMLMTSGGDPTQTGKIINDLFGRFMGTATGAFGDMGRMQNMVRDTLRGGIFDPGSLSRVGGGVSNLQSNRILSDLMRGTFRDESLLKRRGMFGHRDIAEIFRIGRDYEVFTGAATEDIAARTMELGRTIKTGMQTFGTANKEEALKSILETTGGSIPLTDTAQLQNTLQKIKDLGRSANLSVELLKEVTTRGAELSKQMGLTGVTGTNVSLAAIENQRLIRRPDAGGFLTNRLIAEAGGGRNLLMTSAAFGLQSLAGPDMRRTAGLVGAFQARGMTADPIMDALRQGGMLTSEQINRFRQELVGNIQGDLGGTRADQLQAQRTADALMRQHRARGAEALSQDPDLASNLRMGQIIRAGALKATGSAKGILGRLARGEQVSKEDLQTVFPFIQDIGVDVLEKHGVAPAQGRALVAQMFDQLTQAGSLSELRQQQGRTRAQARIQETFMERRRTVDAPLTRAIRSIVGGGTTGDILSALLPQEGELLDLEGVPTERLQKVFAGGRDFIESRLRNPKAALAFRAAANVVGRGGLTTEQARAALGAKVGEASQAEISRVKEKLERDLRSGRIVGVGEVVGALGEELTGGSIGKALAILKKVDEPSFNAAMKSLKDARTAGVTSNDLDELNLAGLTTDELNELPFVQGLAKRFGVEGFESQEDLLAKVRETGDKELTRSVEFAVADSEGKQKLIDKMVKRLRGKSKEVLRRRRELKEAKVSTLRNVALFSGKRITKAGKELELPEVRDIIGRKLGGTSEETLEGIATKASLFGLPFAVMQHLEDAGVEVKDERELAGFTRAIHERMAAKDVTFQRIRSKNLRFTQPTDLDKHQKAAIKAITSQLEDKDIAALFAQKDLDEESAAAFLKRRDIDVDSSKKAVLRGVLHSAQEKLQERVEQEGGFLSKFSDAIEDIKKQNPLMHQIIDLMKSIKDMIASFSDGDKVKTTTRKS